MPLAVILSIGTSLSEGMETLHHVPSPESGPPMFPGKTEPCPSPCTNDYRSECTALNETPGFRDWGRLQLRPQANKKWGSDCVEEMTLLCITMIRVP